MSEIDFFQRLCIYEVNGDTVSKKTFNAVKKLQESNRIMKEALEFYSDDGGRDEEDISAVQKCIMGMIVVIAKGGKRAREALKKTEEV